VDDNQHVVTHGRMEDICRIAGRNVKAARLAVGYNQERLAYEAQVDRTYVSGVERGLRNPSIKVLARLAEVLKTTPAALLSKAP
jgi:transcriptional regulator with XRE-family HTH domain